MRPVTPAERVCYFLIFPTFLLFFIHVYLHLVEVLHLSWVCRLRTEAIYENVYFACCLFEKSISMIALEERPKSGKMIGTFTSRLLFSIITLFYFSVLYYTRGHTYFPVQELGSGISHSAAAPTSSADSEQPRHEFVDIRNSTLGVCLSAAALGRLRAS